MKLTEEHKKRIMELGEEEFKLFIKDIDIALMYQIDDKDDFEYFYEDVEERDGEVEHEEPHDVYQDEIWHRGWILDEFAKTRDIEKFCKKIEYINASMFDIHYYGDKNECFEDFINGEITMELVKDILRYNSD